MKNIYLILFFAFIFSPSYSQNATELRIAPAYASNASVSELFEQINYIPLETTKQSLFGTINQLAIADNYFIILDNATNAILIFEKNGKFHAKISRKPLTISSFKYEKENNRILIYSVNNKAITSQIQDKFQKDIEAALSLYKKFFKLTYYNLDGKKLDVEVPENTFSLSNLSSVQFSKGITASNFALADEQMPDSTAFQLNIYENSRLYKSYFPYNTKKDIAQFGKYLGSGGGFTKSQNDTIIYFTRPLEYAVYQLTPNTLSKKYQFIFPMANTIPQNFFTDTISQENRRSYFNNNRAIITGISNVHVLNNLLFFKINNNDRNRNVSNSFIYNLKSGNLISMNKTRPDTISYFLPVLDYPFSYESFKATEGEYFYTYISSLRMFQSKEATADKKPVYNSVLQTYFTKGNKKDNPVIVQLKPKEDL